MNANDTPSNSGDLHKPIGGDIRTSMQHALDQATDKATDKAQPTLAKMASVAQEGVDKVGDTIDKVSASADAVSNTIGERTKQLAASYQKLGESGREYVRVNPAVTVLLSLAAGYGIAKLMRTRN